MAKPVIPWENYDDRALMGVSSMGITHTMIYAGTDTKGDPIFTSRSFSVHNVFYTLIEDMKNILPELSGWNWDNALADMAWTLGQFLEIRGCDYINKLGTKWALVAFEDESKGGETVDRKLENEFFEKIRK